MLALFNKQSFYYTLAPPLLGDNPVDGFLFDTRRGFCEHYASASSRCCERPGFRHGW